MPRQFWNKEISNAASEFKEYTNYSDLLLFRFNIDLFKKKISRAEIHTTMDFCRIFYGTCDYVPRAIGLPDQNPRHSEQHECTLRSVYWICRHYTDGPDLYRVQTDHENQGIDTGNWDAREKGAGAGG